MESLNISELRGQLNQIADLKNDIDQAISAEKLIGNITREITACGPTTLGNSIDLLLNKKLIDSRNVFQMLSQFGSSGETLIDFLSKVLATGNHELVMEILLHCNGNDGETPVAYELAHSPENADAFDSMVVSKLTEEQQKRLKASRFVTHIDGQTVTQSIMDNSYYSMD